jgi:hypothetical protein
MMQSDAVADSEAAREVLADGHRPRPTTNLHDGAGGFVSKDPRRWHRAILNFFYVRWANPARGNFDEQLVPANARHGYSFDAQNIWASINDGAHGFRNFEHGKLLTQRTVSAKQEKVFYSALKEEDTK